MADHGKFYYGFDEDFANKMASLCYKADIILPNLTEAAFLLNEECKLDSYDNQFIENCLSKAEIKNIKDVLIMTLDNNGDIFIQSKKSSNQKLRIIQLLR